MIVVSLLLILVAVTLLALGLAGGSSPLLISSIIASLLGAVTLVIGARQAATTRRRRLITTESSATRRARAPFTRSRAPAAGSADYGAGVGGERGDAHSDFSGSDPILADNGHSPHAAPDSAAPGRSPDAEPEFAEDRPAAGADTDFAGLPDADLRDARPTAGSPGTARPGADDRAAADDSDSRFADPDDSDGPFADPDGGFVDGSDGRSADDSDGRFADDAVIQQLSESDADVAGRHNAEAASAAEGVRSARDADVGARRQEPGVDGPSTVTGPARAPESDRSRHRDPDADPSPAGHFAGGTAAQDAPPSDRPGVSDRSAPDDFSERPISSDLPDGPGSFEASGLAEIDEDDPADEPPPQSVSPSDAVSLARMDAEVLVVDGRPRYHLGDCPHLSGRQTEPLPANEAVELGFSPCGRCRPVDRLVAGAAHR